LIRRAKKFGGLKAQVVNRRRQSETAGSWRKLKVVRCGAENYTILAVLIAMRLRRSALTRRRGSVDSALAVYDSSLGFVTGGGAIQ
jgi:hypothetical protein